MKKLIALMLTLCLVVACVFTLTACGEAEIHEAEIPAVVDAFDSVKIDSNFKLGVICLHDENSTYDKNFIDAVNRAAAALGLARSQLVVVTGIGEDASCKTKALELADLGCKAIFADSFGHEDYIIEAAQERPNVQFFHATGTKAHTAGLNNYHNAFATIFEGRYLAGVAAGLKLKDMIANGQIKDSNKDANGNIKLGYIGAYTYAEVISGFTSWYLGVKSQVANVVMSVQFTGSWYDETGEKSAAETLIEQGCALISQHADSWGAPNACENAGIPNVSYNGSTISACPETFIISSKIDWTYYFKWIIAAVGGDAEAVPADFAGTLDNGHMVALSNANADVIADGTVEKLVAVRKQLMSGELKVFDCSKFTVTVIGEGANKKNVNATVDAQGHLTGYLADVDSDAAFTPDTQAVKTEGGVTYFAESEFRSAPYFDIQIDGITYLNVAF